MNVWILKDKLHSTMNDTQVQWIGSSCGRHGSYTFYKGFKINYHGKEKSYCLGEFYFVRNSEDRPICIAELQLIWHDASNDSKLASARLYFRPENTPFGRQSIHGKDELLYADQKVIIKCEDMLEWECSGSSWTTGLIPTLETNFKAVKDVCIDKFTGKTENKYRLQNTTLENTDTTPTEKIIILTFQAYCRYIALWKRLLSGMTIAKSEVASLGGIIAHSKSTRIVFCRECFSCPDLDQFHLSGENKAPVLKGRPRKKKIRSSTLAKELKRKRFLADLERVKKNLPSKKMKLSESEEGTESDLSEESNKSYESMDEEKPHYTIETPVNKIKQPNGVIPVSIKQVAKVMAVNEKDLKTVAPPPLIPTVKVKLPPTSPPPLQKVKIKTESPMAPKVNTGPPPLYPATQKLDSLKKTNQSFPRLVPRVEAPENSQTQGNTISLPSSKAFTHIKSSSVGVASSSMSTAVTVSRPEVATYNSVKAVEPLGNAGKQVLIDGKTIRLQDDMKIEGKENKQEGNKTDVIIKPKKKRLRQSCNVKELNEDLADEDEKYFMRSLREFMKSRQTPISKIPALGFKRVNLWTMYSTTQKLGGYDTVTSKRLWRQVYDALGGSTTITSAATYTRRHYERLLLPYESYVRSQLNNKKGLPEQNQSANTSTNQDNTAKGHSINNNQLDTSTNNNDTAVMKDSKMSINRNQSSGSIPRDSSNQSVTTSKDNTCANHKTSHNSLPGKMNTELGATTGSPANTTSHKQLTDNVKTSRNNLSSAIIKVKPNGAIPPYSVSVQSVKKDGVTSKSVIFTKSINVPPSPVVRNSATVLPRSSSAPTSSTKSDVTPNLPQRGTSVTANMTSHQPTVSPALSHSSRPVNHVTPVKSSTPESCSSSVKQSATVKVVHTEKPQKHAVGIVTSPKIYPPQKLTNQDKNSKGIADSHGIKYVSRNGHPVSREEVTPQKAYKLENHSSDLPSLNMQNGLSRERELKHIKEPTHQNHINYHQGNARIIHDPKKYDVISSSTHETFAKSTNKRSTQIDPVANEPMKRKLSEKDVPQAVACHTQSVTNEPVAKRRKTPSPTVIKVTPQPRDVAQVVTTESRNTCHLAYSQTDTFFSSRHAIQSHDNCKLYNDHARFKERTSVNDRKGSQLEPPSVKRIHSQREIVDMTERSVPATSANHSIVYQTTSKTPSYAKITHPKQMYIVGDSCQRTEEPRIHGNSHSSVVKQGKESTLSRGYAEESQSKDSYAPRGHYTEIYPTSQPNYRLVEGLTPSVDRKPSKGDIEQAQLNTDQRTVSHRTFAESPDEHFQEWRRRQGMSQYPAYITTHQNEQQTGRPSVTEQPVSLGLRTPPLEPRYLYVQDEAGIHPRVIEEVPLLLSSKPGMYYHEDTFYGGVPFYHGGWTTAGVADGVAFKGDPDSMNSNSHLRSSSCIFMPTSQMFGSPVSIAPLSPPALNQGHAVSGQDTINIHPRLLMTSPYPHNHQMVSQKPTRPLHSYT